MAVLAVPVGRPFEVSKDKTETFLKCKNKGSGKKIIQERLKNCNLSEVKWEMKK